MLENSYARIFAVELPAQKSTALYKHDYDYVIVTLTDGVVENGRNAAAAVIGHNYTKGDTRFFHGPALIRCTTPSRLYDDLNMSLPL